MTWEEAVIYLKSDESQKQLVLDSYFDDPIELATDRFYKSAEWTNVKEILSEIKPGKALDIGAGRGISTYALAKDGWEVTATEPDNSNIVGAGAIRELIAKTNIKVQISDSYGENLPFENNSFDLVYMRQALHHANNIQKLCNEVFRVLKNGGTFIASREHVVDNQKSLKKFLETHPLQRYYGGEHAYKLKVYKNAILNSGLRIKKILYPFSNDINLAPLTKIELKRTIEKKIKIKIPLPIMIMIFRSLDIFYKQPGRLFTFICRKP